MLSSHATSFLSRCHLEGEHERRGGYVSTCPPSALGPHPGRRKPGHRVSAAPGGHEEQASAGPRTAPENQEGGRTLGHHLSPARRAPAKGPIRDVGASFPSVTPTDQSALRLPTGPGREDVPPGQDCQMELQADGLTAERWEALHPVFPTHLCAAAHLVRGDGGPRPGARERPGHRDRSTPRAGAAGQTVPLGGPGKVCELP